MIILPLLIVVLGISVQRVFGAGTGPFGNENTINLWHNRHLINMTENLCKDAYLKLRRADISLAMYKGTIGYELGILACGIIEKFRHMLRLYRYYSRHSKFKNSEHTITEMMNAYSVLQSDYSELLAEIVMYYQVLEDHHGQNSAKLKKARIYAKKHKLQLSVVIDMMDQGVNLDEMQGMPKTMPENTGRRSMQVVAQPFNDELPDEKVPKKAGNRTRTRRNGTDKEEAAYKKKLRYIMWADKWKGFNPETEGVHIDSTIAKLGFNRSDFLLKELRGDV